MGLADRLKPPGVEEVDARREVLAGVTTFLTMAYILFVNPAIVGGGFELALKQAMGLKPDQQLPPDGQALAQQVKLGIAAGTALAAAFGTLLMALYARLPFAMAPGMGENGFIGYSVIPLFVATLGTLGITGPQAAWTALMVALTAVFVDGLIFLLTAWGGIRERVLRTISPSLATGIAVGIGLFITFIGLVNAGLVTPGVPVVAFNVKAFTTPTTALAFAGLILAAALYARKVPGAFLITIVALTAVGIAAGLAHPPAQVASLPAFNTAILPHLPDSLRWYAEVVALATAVAVSLWLVEFFDGIGTIVGLAQRAGLVKDGRPVNIERALYTDATATVVGALAGTTTTVIYIESAAGIETGGRTGLTSLVTGLLFLASLLLTPLAVAVPSFATAPILILVGLLFVTLVPRINFEDLTEAIPAFTAMVTIPLTYSIATGIGLAFITYTLLKLLTGRHRDITPTTAAITIIFIAYFGALLPTL